MTALSRYGDVSGDPVVDGVGRTLRPARIMMKVISAD
jgi:hypothetical protein